MLWHHQLQHQWSQVSNSKAAQVQRKRRRPSARGVIVTVLLAAVAAATAAAGTAATTATTATATARSKPGAIDSHLRQEAVVRE